MNWAGVYSAQFDFKAASSAVAASPVWASAIPLFKIFSGKIIKLFILTIDFILLMVVKIFKTHCINYMA